MAEKSRLFRIGQPNERPFTLGDLAILLGLAGLLYLGVRLAHAVPQVIQGPKINLTPTCQEKGGIDHGRQEIPDIPRSQVDG